MELGKSAGRSGEMETKEVPAPAAGGIGYLLSKEVEDFETQSHRKEDQDEEEGSINLSEEESETNRGHEKCRGSLYCPLRECGSTIGWDTVRRERIEVYVAGVVLPSGLLCSCEEILCVFMRTSRTSHDRSRERRDADSKSLTGDTAKPTSA
jgi:hypothetical protein